MAFGKFGRYHPDGADVKPARFDLVALLRRDVERVAAGSGAGHSLRFETDTPSLLVETDADHVRYIAVNLLQNAVKYSAPGSEVLLALDTSNGRIAMRVSDQGIGVPAAEVERLFSPFYRASNVGAREGTGMGLPIVKKSASLIGATVELRTAEGEGTEFTVTLAG